MANPFDQFDSSATVVAVPNPFDRFDVASVAAVPAPKRAPIIPIGSFEPGELPPMRTQQDVESMRQAVLTPIIGYGEQRGGLATVPGLPQGNPGVTLPGPLPIPEDVAYAGVNALGKLASGLTSPFNVELMAAAPLTAAVPTANRIASGLFGIDMLHSAAQQVEPVVQTLTNPEATRQQKLESVGELGGTALLSGLAARHAVERARALPPEQATRLLREEAVVNADKETAAALEKLAADIENQAAEQARVAQDAAKAAADQQKAVADAQKAAQEQAAAPEVPKSTQILMEPVTKPPALANVATEIGTQTSPFAVQGKLNELTGVKSEPVPALPAELAKIVPEGEVAPVAPEKPALSDAQIRSDYIKSATEAPEVDYQYIVQDFGPPYPRVIQVDAISQGESLASGTVKEFNDAGAGIKEVPDWVPQGKYTREQVEKMISEKRFGRFEVVGSHLRGDAKTGSDVDVVTTLTPEERLTLASNGPEEYPILPQDIRERVLSGNGDVFIQDGGKLYKVDEHPVQPGEFVIERVSEKEQNILSGGKKNEDLKFTSREDTLNRIRNSQPTGEPTHALPIQKPNASLLRGEAPQPELNVELPRVGEGNAVAQEAPRNQMREGAVQEPLSEAQQIAASAPAQPVAGRPAAATLRAAQVRHSLIADSRLERWADSTIKRINKEGRQYSGIDPEYAAAATVKLIAQIERGVVDFATWSAEQIREFGEKVRPVLEQVWKDAHDRTPPRSPLYRQEDLGPNSAAGYDRDILRITDERRKAYANTLADFAEATGDWDRVYQHLMDDNGVAPEYRPIAAAELAMRAERVPDPDLREALVRRFATATLDTLSQAGQTLQAGKEANRTIGPLTGYMAWLGLMRTRLEPLAKRFGPDAAEKVRAGIRKAGEEATGLISEATQENAVKGKDNALLAPLRKIAKQTGVDWKAVFTDLPEKQAERKAELVNRLLADPRLANLPEATRRALADAADKAWESVRNGVFRREFARLVPLPNVAQEAIVKVKDSLPELIKQANLGLLDNEAFLSALGKRYGIEGLDSATATKLRELGEKAMRTPQGVERNRVFQEIEDTILKTRGVDWPALLRDWWYRNVMSAPRTLFELGAGGLVQGAFRTVETAADTAIGLGRPDIAFRMLGMFLQDIRVGALSAKDIIKTGDRTSLPRYEKQFLAGMEKMSKGGSPTGQIESLYRRGGIGTKLAVGAQEMTGRALIGFDYIGGQAVRDQQMLYSALVNKDRASFDAIMQRFNKDATEAARKQAMEELPNGRPVEITQRSREILQEKVADNVKEFGNLMTEVTALNATPVGLGGQVYRGLNNIPFFSVAKFPAGAAFLKAGINLFQRYTDFLPGTGQLNFLRGKLDPETSFGKIFSLAKDVSPERQRQQIVAQYMGLAALGATTYYFLRDDKPDNVEISGSWFGLSPERQRALRTAGEAPLSIKAPWTGNKWVSYRLTPLLPVFAVVGNWRDQERLNNQKWSEKDKATKVVNAWLAGLVSIKDLALASQASEVVSGLLGTDQNAPEADKALKTLANTFGSTAVGVVPMSSLLREIDNYTDEQRYTANKNSGVDLWMRQVPFVRRGVNEGRPTLDFFGNPVRVVVTPANRHVAPDHPVGPEYDAIADKIGQGMTVPVPAPLEHAVGPGATLVEPSDDVAYGYQKAVRNALQAQIGADLTAFTAASPEAASLYAQNVVNRAATYVADRINTGKPIPIVPVDPRAGEALSPEYQAIKEMDKAEAGAVKQAGAQKRIDVETFQNAEDKGAALREMGVRRALPAVRGALAPSATRGPMEKAEANLSPATRAKYLREQMAGMTQEQKAQFLRDQLRAGLLSQDVLKELAVGG